MKMFEVEAKCGHVGRKYYTLKVFPVIAESRKQAAAIARNIPRVKHHHKDAIRRVDEISLDRFRELNEINNRDPYFFCKNIQEHRLYVTSCDMFLEDLFEGFSQETNKKPIYLGKELLKKPKKFYNRYYNEGLRGEL